MPVLMALALAADPVPPTLAALASGAAAAAVVQHYYRALSARDYATAHAIFANGHSIAQMRQGYTATRWTHVTTLPPYSTEGGAGSVYSEIRVVVNAMLRSGKRQRFTGSYTLRRVNDIEGSTAAQRRWHIDQAHLHEVAARR